MELFPHENKIKTMLSRSKHLELPLSSWRSRLSAEEDLEWANEVAHVYSKIKLGFFFLFDKYVNFHTSASQSATCCNQLVSVMSKLRPFKKKTLPKEAGFLFI